ncbi:Apolipoprotein N-acyltransferase, partial [Mycobacterium ahvazicum]
VSEISRITTGLGLSLSSAALLVIMWPSFGNLWWLCFIAFVPMYAAQYRVLPRRWSAVPVATAFAGYYLGLLMHIASALSVGVIIGGALAFGFIGLVVGVFLRPFAERTGYRWFVVQFGLLWVAIDLLLQDNEFDGTYLWIAYRLADLPQIVQPISITGAPALSLLLHVVNAAMALVVISLLDRRWPQWADTVVPRRALAWSVVIPVVVMIAWTGTSLAIFHDVSDRMGPRVRVATVQPGLDNTFPGTLASADFSHGRSQEERIKDQIAQLSAMTRAASAQGAKVAVWPEETLDYDPRVSHPDWIPALVRQTGVYLAMGFTPDAANDAAPNTALLWSPAGEVVAVYYKTMRVLTAGEAFTPGRVYPAVPTPQGVLGMVICFDMDFPNGPTRRTVLNGAQMVLSPSLDLPSKVDIRKSMAVFRAVENRVALVKADVAWDSMLVAPNGEVITGTAVHDELGGQALLVADVPLGPRGAPFTHYGDAPFQWLEYAATAALLCVMAVSWRRTASSVRRR